jgi:oligosaccharide repeat unit polymerase
MPEILDKCFALALSLMILWQASLVRRMVGTWLFPACIFGLFWFAYTFVPLVLLASAPVDPVAIAFILVCTTVFSASSLCFDWRYAFHQNGLKGHTGDEAYDNLFCRISFYGAIALSLLFLVMNSVLQGITVYDLIFDFFASAARYTELRYAEEIDVNIFGQLSLVLSYVGVTLGGFVYVHSRSRGMRWLVVCAAFLPSLLVMLTQSAKGLFLLSVVMFYGATLVCRLSRDNRTLLGKGTATRAIVWTALASPVLIVSFLTRGLYGSEDTGYVIERLIYYFMSYSSGHLYAFSDWFANFSGRQSVMQYANDVGSYGFYTFMALFKLFGIDRAVPQGVYDEYFFYGDLLSSNIYTIYRGLIIDFGVLGSFVFMFATGVLLHLCFFVMLVNRKPVVTVAVFIYMIAYFQTSFLISVLMWNSIYVSFALLVAILLCNKILNDSGRTSSVARAIPARKPSPVPIENVGA